MLHGAPPRCTKSRSTAEDVPKPGVLGLFYALRRRECASMRRKGRRPDATLPVNTDLTAPCAVTSGLAVGGLSSFLGGNIDWACKTASTTDQTYILSRRRGAGRIALLS